MHTCPPCVPACPLVIQADKVLGKNISSPLGIAIPTVPEGQEERYYYSDRLVGAGIQAQNQAAAVATLLLAGKGGNGRAWS